MDHLQEQEDNIKGSHHFKHMDKEPEEKEAIQITVEDLGIVNSSFTLLEEEQLIPRSNAAHSASSVSGCPRALRKKRLKPPCSLLNQPQVKLAVTNTSRDDNDDEVREDILLFESGTNSMATSGSLLTQPVINLIPPTPSDVADDGQFFDVTSEERLVPTPGGDGSLTADESYEEKVEKVGAEESTEAGVAAILVSAESAVEPGDGQNGQSGDKRVIWSDKDRDEENAKPGFLRSTCQVVPLPQHVLKSESLSPVLLMFC